MVTNPQERPRISWVLDQVQSLRGSDGTDVDTNRVWCYHWDFMPVFQWTPDFLDYALSLPDKNHKPCKHLLSLTSVSSACLSYTRKFVDESHIFTPKSQKLSDDLGVKYELGMFLIYATQTTREGKNPVHHSGTCYVSSNWLFSDCNLASVSFYTFLSLYILRNQKNIYDGFNWVLQGWRQPKKD